MAAGLIGAGRWPLADNDHPLMRWNWTRPREATTQTTPVLYHLWLVCAGATVAAAVLASRSRRPVRAATGTFFIVGGALLHVLNLATGGNYSGFADPAL
jgi:hypothetical protein